jgi:hypothetical protein
MTVSPLYIEIALHYHIHSDDFPILRRESCAGRAAINKMVGAGLLAHRDTGARTYEPTEGLRVWIEALCATPFPERRWVMPEPTQRG